jgi:hypothetical protein
MGRRAATLGMAMIVLGVSGLCRGQQQASDPFPADGATDVVMAVFRWTPGSGAVFHTIYLGTTPDLGPGQLLFAKWAQGPFFLSPAPLELGTTYYWRVDEVERDGVTTHTGDVWSFIAQPFTAFRPDPADGYNEEGLAPNLQWLVGQGAAQHHVYFGDSQAAVAAGATEVDKGVVMEPNYVPGVLEPTTTYYWRVDEVTFDGSEVAGAVWSFTTILPVDDFESYNDEEEQGTRIYETWLDGVTNGSGMTVGYWDPPFAEQTIVHGGQQSMPLDYNNMSAPYFSEAEREFDAPQDWTANDANTLVFYVQGRGVDFQVLSVNTPPVLDGQVDEIWAQASVFPLNTVVTAPAPTGPADASGQFRVLYDATNLYVLVDVNDEKLVGDSDKNTAWWDDDSVEFYFDGGNTKGPGTPLAGDDRQYTFGWGTTVVQGTNMNLDGVVQAQVTTATGWRIEIKLPWQTLMGTGAPVGQLIGVDCFYNDDDDGGTRDSQISWHSQSGGDWQVPASWGTALVAAPASPSGEDRLYVVLEDATTARHQGIVVNPDQEILKARDWVSWKIPLQSFADAGVNLAKVKKLYIGVGDRANPVAGGAGRLFLDDLYLTRPAPAGQ